MPAVRFKLAQGSQLTLPIPSFYPSADCWRQWLRSAHWRLSWLRQPSPVSCPTCRLCLLRCAARQVGGRSAVTSHVAAAFPGRDRPSCCRSCVTTVGCVLQWYHRRTTARTVQHAPCHPPPRCPQAPRLPPSCCASCSWPTPALVLTTHCTGVPAGIALGYMQALFASLLSSLVVFFPCMHPVHHTCHPPASSCRLGRFAFYRMVPRHTDSYSLCYSGEGSAEAGIGHPLAGFDRLWQRQQHAETDGACCVGWCCSPMGLAPTQPFPQRGRAPPSPFLMQPS